MPYNPSSTAAQVWGVFNDNARARIEKEQWRIDEKTRHAANLAEMAYKLTQAKKAQADAVAQQRRNEWAGADSGDGNTSNFVLAQQLELKRMRAELNQKQIESQNKKLENARLKQTGINQILATSSSQEEYEENLRTVADTYGFEEATSVYENHPAWSPELTEQFTDLSLSPKDRLAQENDERTHKFNEKKLVLEQENHEDTEARLRRKDMAQAFIDDRKLKLEEAEANGVDTQEYSLALRAIDNMYGYSTFYGIKDENKAGEYSFAVQLLESQMVKDGKKVAPTTAAANAKAETDKLIAGIQKDVAKGKRDAVIQNLTEKGIDPRFFSFYLNQKTGK